MVDLLLKPEVPFEELLARSQEALVGDTPVRVVSLDDLITLKRHAGRSQDLADIEELERFWFMSLHSLKTRSSACIRLG